MLNILTIDLEDYFQVHAFSNVVKFEDWGNYESRIEPNTFRLLEILNGSIGLNNSMNSINPINPSNPTAARQHSSTAARCLPKTTFFILGWLAERYPHLIRTIKKEGHEIACHGYAHKMIYTQSKDEFREDIKKAKAILEDVSGDEVIGYRAPSYSITNKSQWAFEILVEEGFRYDSSIFPIHHDFYGFPEAPRFPFLISMDGNSDFKFQISNFKLKETESSVNPTDSMNPTNSSNSSNPQSAIRIPHSSTESSVLSPQSSSNISASPYALCPMPHAPSIVEFPLSTVRILGTNWPVAGGGYFRLFPYPLIKKGLTRINRIEGMPFIFYLHPWELDDEQPRIDSISMFSRFRHYVNLDKTEPKFKKLLSDFNFCSIREVINSITQVTQVTQ